MSKEKALEKPALDPETQKVSLFNHYFNFQNPFKFISNFSQKFRRQKSYPKAKF
jgi:hypothetical protein